MTEYFYKNKEGKVEFTEDALKTLLDRVYNQGYNDGKNTGSIIWNSPSKWYDDWYTKPYITWSNSGTATSTDYCDTSTTTTSNVTLTNQDISDLHVK